MSQEINLYQPIFRREKVVFSAVTLVGLVFGFAAVFLAFAMLTGLRVDDLNAELEQRTQAEQELTRRLAELQETLGARAPDPELERQVERAGKRLQELRNGQDAVLSRVPDQALSLVAPLAALGKEHPSGLWLTRIELSENGAEMTLAGRALNAERLPVFLGNLRNAPALRGLSFQTLSVEAQNDQEVVFRVSTGLEDSAQ